MFYLVRPPWVFRQYYWECLWEVETEEKKIFLTFDDGPSPEITEFVLRQLGQYDARATFFCIGKNVEANPGLYQQILSDGHSTGNHTYSHLNGWKTNSEKYIEDIDRASNFITGKLFRPPYGRISKFQLYNLINGQGLRYKPVMWHVLSGDFDPKTKPEQCYLNVTRNAGKGSIVVFHDSKKAFPNLKEVLPRVLKFYTEKGFTFEQLDKYILK